MEACNGRYGCSISAAGELDCSASTENPWSVDFSFCAIKSIKNNTLNRFTNVAILYVPYDGAALTHSTLVRPQDLNGVLT